jgi:hypothetical protein
MNKTFNRILAGAGFLAIATASQAAAIDVAAVVTDIGAQMASITLVGGAVLVLHVGVKAFKWVRSALS